MFNDDALDTVITTMAEDKSKIWNSVELAQLYFDYGSVLTRRNITTALCDHFGTDLLVLTSPGVANLLVFRQTCKLGIVDADEDRCDVKRLVYDICNETKKADMDYYDLYLNDENINDGVNDTLLYFLKQLKLPESSFIANVVTSCLSKSPNRTLQLAIAVFLKKKAFIDALRLVSPLLTMNLRDLNLLLLCILQMKRSPKFYH